MEVVVYFMIMIMMMSVFTVLGQVLIKWRLNAINFSLQGDSLDKIYSVAGLVFDKFIFLGLFSAMVAAFFWIAAISKYNLSFAYPITVSLVAIMTVTSSVLILGERLKFIEIIGISIIIIGILVMFYGQKT
jgi:undecaprenyl phosphate-alpha-L-ara4N flippase subunit ArnF